MLNSILYSHRQREGAVSGDVVVHCLGPAGVDHADVVIYEQLGHDGLLCLRWAWLLLVVIVSY